MLRHLSSPAYAFRVTIILLLSYSALLPSAAAQEAGKRVALIIGNNNYAVSPLRNAVNDAKLMDNALRAAGFQTLLHEDATQGAMEQAVADFLQLLGPDDTALFFYAGHGVQIENENFLVPVDFEPTSTVIQAKLKFFRLSLLFEELKNKPKRSIIVLDACRSNPIAQARSLQAGLAQPQVAGAETFIAFSTGPGQVAADNPNGRDSWFTEALADLISQDALSLDEVFTRVKSRVSNETERRQSPWTTSSLSSTFYFHAPSDLKAESSTAQAEKWMLEARKREQWQEWDDAIDLVNRVIQSKPGGTLEANAQKRLPYLVARRDARTQFDAGNLKAASALSEQALKLDPFSIDVAFEGVSSYLLADQLPEAVGLLSAIRTRGTDASIEKANGMLKALATVYPEAGKIVNTPIPSPPPIQDLFTTIQFGAPDWEGGIRFARSARVELGRSIQKLEAANPLPEDTPGFQSGSDPGALASAADIADKIFHVEVSPVGDKENRDIAIRRLGSQTSGGDAGPYGFLTLKGLPGDAPVLLNGSTVSGQQANNLKLPPGKYRVSGVRDGKPVGAIDVDVIAAQTITVQVPQ
jgi:tetratricopeptide (TPR) repeat protein